MGLLRDSPQDQHGPGTSTHSSQDQHGISMGQPTGDTLACSWRDSAAVLARASCRGPDQVEKRQLTSCSIGTTAQPNLGGVPPASHR